MKDNKNYILLALVIIIWGYAMYSFFGTFGSDKQHTLIGKSKINSNEGDNLKEESFELLANYKDPFLGKAFSSSLSGTGSPTVKVKKKEVLVKAPEAAVDLSFISFVGLIRNPSNDKKVALVSLNNNQYMASEGQVINNVLFKKNTKDSISIVFNNKTYFIKRK